MYNKELVLKKYKELSYNSTLKRSINQLKIGKGFEPAFLNIIEDVQVANKSIKRCSESLLIREIQIKTTVRSTSHPLRWLE